MIGSTFCPKPGIRCTAPLLFETPQGRIEDDQFAHPLHAMVAGDDGHDLRRVAGDRPGVERRVRPIGIAAVVGRLVRAVGIHREQQPREVVRRVGVFPAGIQDAAVVEHRRAPVVVLIEA